MNLVATNNCGSDRPSEPPSKFAVLPFRILFSMMFLCGCLQSAAGQSIDKSKYLNRGNIKQSPRVAGNGVYEVVVEDILGKGVGLYSVRTGEKHPLNSIALNKTSPFSKKKDRKVDLLFGGVDGLTGTSFTSIRSYSSQIDYFQSEFATQEVSFHGVWLDSLFINEDSVATDYFIEVMTGELVTGFQVRYNLPGLPRQFDPGVVPDTLEVTEIINVRGSTYDNSWVEITTVIKNLMSTPVDLGVRYLWDFKIAGDDGTPFHEKFNGDFGPHEITLTAADKAFFFVTANDTMQQSNPPDYEIICSALTPANMSRTPYQPHWISQASWPLAFFKPFDYTAHFGLDVTTPNDPNAGLVGGDNAALFFWGKDPHRALRVEPGDSIVVTQAILGMPTDGAVPKVVDSENPRCSIVDRSSQRINVLAADLESGLRSITLSSVFNASVDLPRVNVGTTQSIFIAAEALNPVEPFGFQIELTDLCGNQTSCDPVLLTLRPEYHRAGKRFEILPIDRFLYINNHGLERILLDVNASEFTLSSPAVQASAVSMVRIPHNGEVSFDITDYLRPEGNTVALACDGPPGSFAEFILADMPLLASPPIASAVQSLPAQYTLEQNSPNPVRTTTSITFNLPANEQNVHQVEINVYNLLGQHVRTLSKGQYLPGNHNVMWDGLDDAGHELRAGAYFYRLLTEDQQLTRKLTIVR